MKERGAKKHKGVLFYALVGLCLGVWGYVFYQITHGVGEAGDPFAVNPLAAPALAPAPRRALRRPAPRGTYAGSFRDPFARPSRLLRPQSVAPQRPVRSPAEEPPPFVLSGIVDRTALLQGTEGSVFVVRAGEQAGRVHVLTVDPGRVVVRFEGRSYTLHLSP